MLSARITVIFERIFHGLLYAALFTPLLILQSTVYPLNTIKVVAFIVLVAGMLLIWVPLALAKAEFRPRFGAVQKALALFIVVLVIASLAGLDPERSFWSTEDRALGLLAVIYFFLYSLLLSGAGPRFSWERYLYVSLGVSVITALPAYAWSMLHDVFLDPLGNRPGTFFGNPTFLAAYLLFHVFYAAYFFVRTLRYERHRYLVVLLWGGTVLVLVGTIFLTQTRGALLGLAGGTLVALAAFAFSHEGTRIRVTRNISMRTVGITLITASIAAAGIFWMTRSAPLWQQIPGVSRLAQLDATSASIQPRLIALGIAWDAFTERPLIGYGFENFKYPFDARYDPSLLRYASAETFWDKPHNIFFEYAVAGGIVALIAYGLLLIAVVRAILRNGALDGFAPFGLGLFVAYLIQNTFVFDTYGSYLALFAFLALITSKPHGGESAVPTTVALPQITQVSGIVLGIVAVSSMLFVHGSVFAVNRKEYQGLNYFVNRLPTEAVSAFRTAIAAPVSPYRDQVVRNYVSSMSQMWSQGIAAPDMGRLVPETMDELAQVIEENPLDFFNRVTWADAATVFWRFDPAYLDTANAYLDDAEAVSPNRQQIRYIRSKIAYLKGQPEEARRVMEEAIALDPKLGEPYFYAGLLTLQMGDIQDGLAHIERARELGREPRNAQEMVILAGYYGDADDYKTAIQLYERALGENLDMLEARLKLGLSYYYTNDWDAARFHIEQVVESIDITKAPAFLQLQPILDDLRVVYTTPE